MTIYRKHNQISVLKSAHYAKHVSAMTGEDLFDKSDIAEELAARDMEIERLTAELDNVKQVEFPKRVDKVVECWRKKCDALTQERDALTHEVSAANHNATTAYEAMSSALKERDALAAKVESMEKDIRAMDAALSAGNRSKCLTLVRAACSSLSISGRILLADRDKRVKTKAMREADKDAARYRWLREHRDVLLVTGFFGHGCINRTVAEVDTAIDFAMADAIEKGGES